MDQETVIFLQRGLRLRPASTEDAWGSTAEDWESAVRKELRCLGPTQLSSAEQLNASDTTVTQHRLFFPAKTDITETDRWHQGGITYRIAGKPARPGGPLGEHHVEVIIEEITP